MGSMRRLTLHIRFRTLIPSIAMSYMLGTFDRPLLEKEKIFMIKQKHMRIFFLFILVLVFLISACWMRYTSDTNKGVGDHTGSIIFNGLERSYLVHIPPFYNKTKSMPLVIALHGGGGTGKRMAKLTQGGFNTLADKEGFIVVYPDGIEKHWNDGRKEVKYRTHQEKIDDVGFISALIDHLVEVLNVNPNRVYVTGMSNGAMMSYRLAFELSEKIAAIAPVTGNIPVDLSGTPKRPISVLIVNNIEDPCMPWEGGYVQVGRIKLGRVLSTSETVKYWVKHNQCSLTPTIICEPDRDPNDDTRVCKEVYGNCKEGTEVILFAVEGGGHTWPGGWQYLPGWIVGKTSKDIDANEVIWNFFKKHVRNSV